MASETLHENPATLGAEVIDRHRALSSLIEELEAIDWYDQRVQAAGDAALRAILSHNRDDEKEHAALLLQWLEQHDAAFAAEMNCRRAGGKQPGDSAATAAPGDLGIGDLRGLG